MLAAGRARAAGRRTAHRLRRGQARAVAAPRGMEAPGRRSARSCEQRRIRTSYLNHDRDPVLGPVNDALAQGQQRNATTRLHAGGRGVEASLSLVEALQVAHELVVAHRDPGRRHREADAEVLERNDQTGMRIGGFDGRVWSRRSEAEARVACARRGGTRMTGAAPEVVLQADFDVRRRKALATSADEGARAKGEGSGEGGIIG